ncbi:hypothetical protein J5N97_020013 [Dioscorea zingiberensis]|uniref:Dirigent protein n=1 Tax=Dioscorea zingiberensis TaxID=325984 RepID=A0A9D5CFM2_9LILI|nr:hypothetical protein J5N97_020013 [Dioscorea zingiberensis]
MAKPLLLLLTITITITLTTTAIDKTSAAKTSPSPKKLMMNSMHKKLSHFRVYWHDVVSGPHPSSSVVAQSAATNTSRSAFGLVRVIDNALTRGPAITSELVGRAQGFYASASLDYVGLLMAMNFAFTGGKYNGSTLTILGRNEVFTEVREMPIIGGSGLFRWAQGYAQARTNMVNLTTGDAIVQYDLHVMHY